MTATLHALGCGRAAGAYYTEDPHREANPRSRDNYYTRDGGNGTWWSTASNIVQDGSSIDRQTFRNLCAGIDPRTGKGLVRAAGPRHRAGWDVTFSSPKTFGILWASGNEEQRAMLETVQQKAVDRALQFLVDERLIEVRLGAGGHLREAPTDLLVAKFPHFTSRAGDPSCHVHSIIMNAARAPDRKRYLTVEPRNTYAAQVLVGLAFRTALSKYLVEMGFSIRPAGRDQFEIDGIPIEMIEHFSKRSQQIRAYAGDGASAAEKEIAALATRRDKATVPTGNALERRWQEELATFKVDAWEEAFKAGRMPKPQRAEHDYDLDPPEVAGDSPVALAASKMFRNQSVLKRSELLRHALVEASLKGIGIEPVYAEIRDLESSGRLVRLDRNEVAQHWTTTAVAANEAKLLHHVKSMTAGTWFKPEAIEAALSNASNLSGEQRRALLNATSTEPTSILEAGAGTGKTFLANVIAQAARKSGLTILGLAPSWVAADELSRSIGVEALAIARFRHEIETGKRKPPDETCLVLLDEAGMASTQDILAVYAASCANGHQSRMPKILLLGDRRQLQSVGGASALRAIVDLVERKSTLTGIRRQTVDWQRAASVVMAEGNSEAGLRKYAEQNRIEMVAGRQNTQERTIKQWKDFRQTYGDDVIIVTRKNSDAVALNLAAREVLREQGFVRGEDVLLETVDRDGCLTNLPLARGDRVRFGETLHEHGVRNGTRGSIVKCGPDPTVRVTIRLDDGRIIEDNWAGFSQKGRRRHVGIPKIVHAIAGSAYSAQGRTALATVYHIAKATDARETYVALTRHRNDVQIVVESDRLDAICRARQEDPRMPPTQSVLLERLFGEARRYHEKANVIDFVEDRTNFIETGSVELLRAKAYFGMAYVAEAARCIESVGRSINVTASLLFDELRHRAMRATPDGQMSQAARTLVSKVMTWIRAPRMAAERVRQRQSVAPEYDR